MASNHGHNVHHITPVATYFKVAGALFGLTILTVVAHQMHLGAWAGPVAFLIAAIKAILVMLWFMHLKYETNMNRLIFGSSFLFLILLFILSELDIVTRVFETSTL
jgi:cytochrome c oxidase subunit IV